MGITSMKAITLHPEWAHAICHLGKDIENRTWKPPQRILGKRIALHAGKKVKNKNIIPSNANVKTGCVIATMIIDAVATNHDSKWAIDGHYHWVIRDVEILDKPIPAKGKLGLWEFNGLQ